MKISTGRAQLRQEKLTWIDGEIWANRSRHWLNDSDAPIKTKISPRRTHEPLILTGYGMGISVRNGALFVKDGFTHYPQKRAEYRFFARDPNLPSRILIVGGTGGLSFSAIDWLSVQNVPLIRINWRGEIQSIIGQTRYSADFGKVIAQREAQKDNLEISIGLIRAKIRQCIFTLQESFTPSVKRASSLAKLSAFERQLSLTPPTSISSLLAIEGNAALAYFELWQTLTVNWSGTGRRPIPLDWYRVGPRSSIARRKIKNRNAMHPVNAMLNYGYGVLESQASLAIVAEGLDPAISYLHSQRKDRSGLVFDLMEPLRPLVDGAILQFIKNETFRPSDFTLKSDGVCRLNPELARLLTRNVLARLANSDANFRTVLLNGGRKKLQQSKT